MLSIHPQYITDTAGRKISVVLPVKEFDDILEELEDVCSYDAAKADNEPAIPLDEAFKTIEAERQRN